LSPEELKQFSLLAELTEEDRDELLELLDREELPAGELLFEEGDEADALYLVASGQLRIRSSRLADLGLIREGGALGSFSVVVIGKRESSAIAESDCVLYSLTRSGFRRLAEDAPRTACRLAEAMVAELAAGVRPRLDHIVESFDPTS